MKKFLPILLVFALHIWIPTASGQVQIEGWHVYPVLNRCPDSVPEHGSLDISIGLPKVWTKEQIAQIKFEWTLSHGRITDGQATNKITADPGEGNITLTVDVAISGPMFPNVVERCNIRVLRPEPRVFQEFTFSNEEHFQMLSDLFFEELANNPSDRGVVMLYARTNLDIRRLQNLLQRWTSFRKFDAKRFRVVNVLGHATRSVQFWMVPGGADEPRPGLLSSKTKRSWL